MSEFNIFDLETQALHAGQEEPDSASGARAVPIYETTSYVFPSTEHAQGVFGLTTPGNVYTRITNPTVAAFEQRISDLEDGVGAVATSSGMAAITLAILNIAGTGDEIIADSNLYGGTYNLFLNTLPKYGINFKLVDGTNPENFRAAITDNTKAIFGETITNPSLNVFDIEAVAEIAHENGLPLIIDNTFATPFITKPISWGADIVIHSATKWIGGHGTTIGGVVVDGGRFNWDNPRFPEFTTPDESYKGLKYVDVGPAAFATKLRVQLLRDIGASLSPKSAFTFIQGLESLQVRIDRHLENTKDVVAYLKNHPAVEWVNYPGLEEHPSYELGKKYLKRGAGSIITFGIKGGREAGRKLIDSITLWSHVANVGDSKSLIIHPASTTHQQLNAEDLKKSGTPEELVRLSIGLESTKDILKDLDQAIAKATGEAPQITPTAEDAVNWLLHSPFDRSEGLRKKAIAVAGVEDATEKKLRNYGFEVIAVENAEQLSDVSGSLDALVVNAEELPKEIIEQLINKESKILWLETNADDATAEHAQAAGIQVVESKSIASELDRIRGSKAAKETIEI
ncbi:PLP-dependent aspartate aminotransferase family protein [Oceanobacillus alkalisoli]|uniref:PLP-dependent aspartate aminotransferase family protein n=1 Tax=Oceanobacillus alkalisoli TaxID=2925113 RepID=UPI001F12284F|nr:PLP-dependent transferase [Oceanobacillus alkalisoli]MCF3943508.1 aminotransferase class I/II-fold pyridoxal phosphate-dependent enzyme [Oceanobacillus alkalisoli]